MLSLKVGERAGGGTGRNLPSPALFVRNNKTNVRQKRVENKEAAENMQ